MTNPRSRSGSRRRRGGPSGNGLPRADRRARGGPCRGRPRLPTVAASERTAVVEAPHEEPAAREEVVEERRRSPCVPDDLRVRAAVDEDDDRVLSGGIETRRLDEPPF